MMDVLNVKELCRLCAKSGDTSAGVTGNDQQSALALFIQYSGLKIVTNENLSAKVCLECHEKIMTFHQYISDCKKVQELFQRWIDNDELEELENEIKNECDILLKREIKQEVSLEDIAEIPILDDGESITDVYDPDPDLLIQSCTSDTEDEKPLKLLSKKKKKIFKRKIKTGPKRRVTTKVKERMEKLEQLLREPDLDMKNIVKLECKYCNENFPTWYNFTKHFSDKHNDKKPSAICICGRPVKSKSVMYAHMSEHKKMRLKLLTDPEDENQKLQRLNVADFINFKCNFCKEDYFTWYRLKRHLVHAHNAAPVVQCACGITIKSKSTMYKHIADHKDPTLFTCTLCPTVTKSESAMEKHQLRHVPKTERVFKCEHCTRTFKAKELLKSHQRVHVPKEQRRQHPCNICDMKFTSRSGALSHKRAVHDKIKSYICDFCGYRCSTSGELKQHRAIHSDDKPYVCSTCNKPFKTYSNLKTHMDTHDSTSYQCYICCRILNSRRTLRKHLLVHDDKCKHVCSFCNKAFKRRQTLKVHLHSHTGDKPLACKWCGERFAYGSTLRSHKLRCHPDKLQEVQEHHEMPNIQMHHMSKMREDGAQMPIILQSNVDKIREDVVIPMPMLLPVNMDKLRQEVGQISMALAPNINQNALKDEKTNICDLESMAKTAEEMKKFYT